MKENVSGHLDAVLYEMLTGRGPFVGPTFSDTVAIILTGTPELGESSPAEDPSGGSVPPEVPAQK